jgi:hypothetical protein
LLKGVGGGVVFRVFIVPMKIISYNVRGFGGYEKRSEVRRLVVDKKPVVLCLQESKLSVVDDLLIENIWRSSPSGFSFQSSIGASSSLTVWDSNVVEVWSTMSFPPILVIIGQVIETCQEFVIANVYAPYDTALKQVLWDQLKLFVVNNGDANICLCGNFNSVRSLEERRWRGSFIRQHDSDIFNKFIDDGSLINLPICGRLFTWYRGDGFSMSRLDRFLLSSNWCIVWPNCTAG